MCPPPADPRLDAPSARRNRDAILAVLRTVVPATGTVLEVASGSGQHAVHFAAALPDLAWQPSDPDPAARASIDAWVAESRLTNVRPALELDARTPDWPALAIDAVLCINMIHIAPWSACEGLVAGAARLLAPGAPLFLYGPFRVNGRHVAQSNEDFDRDLRARDPEWGVRDIDDVAGVGLAHGFALSERIATPRNNFSLVFRRT